MKKIHIILLILFSLSIKTFGQVGIGTDNVESGVILKIEAKPNVNSSYQGGVLLPKIPLTGNDAYAPATGTAVNSLLIYNTNTVSGSNAVTPGYYYWNSTTNLWDDLYEPIKKDICKYSNQDTTTNFNSGSSYMDLFANLIENENTSLYNKIDNTTLRINETGLYKVVLNLDMRVRQAGQDRDVFGVGLYLGNTRVSGQVVVMTNETASGMTQTLGKSVTLFLTVPSGGGDLRIRGYEIHGLSDILFSAPQTSSIYIERVR